MNASRHLQLDSRKILDGERITDLKKENHYFNMTARNYIKEIT